MVTFTLSQNTVIVEGEGNGLSLQCGLYDARAVGTNNVEIYNITTNKVALSLKYNAIGGDISPVSQSTAVSELGELLRSNTALGKVYVDGSDIKLGYLEDKLEAGSGITLTVTNSGTDHEKLKIDAGAGASISSKQVAGNSTTTYHPFIGTTGKSILVLYFDNQIARNLAPIITYTYDNITDTLVVGSSTIKLLTVIYD